MCFHKSNSHRLLFIKLGKITAADKVMNPLDFGRNLADSWIWINPEIRIYILDYFWLRQPKFKGSYALGIGIWYVLSECCLGIIIVQAERMHHWKQMSVISRIQSYLLVHVRMFQWWDPDQDGECQDQDNKINLITMTKRVKKYCLETVTIQYSVSRLPITLITVSIEFILAETKMTLQMCFIRFWWVASTRRQVWTMYKGKLNDKFAAHPPTGNGSDL